MTSPYNVTRRHVAPRAGPPRTGLYLQLKRGGFIEGHYSLYSQLKRGGFIEDKVGQAQLNELRRFGLSSHARHGTWIVDDGVEDRLTGHLDGGHFRKDKWLQAKKSRGWTFRDVVESLGGGEEVEGCEGGVGGERGGKKGDENGEG